MADRHGQGIRCMVGLRWTVEVEEALDHLLDALLVGGAVAGDGQLDFGWSVFFDGHAVVGGHEVGDGDGVRDIDCRGQASRIAQALNGDIGYGVAFEQLPEAVANVRQTRSQRLAGPRGEAVVRYMVQLAVPVNEAEAEAGRPGVNAERQHEQRRLAGLAAEHRGTSVSASGLVGDAGGQAAGFRRRFAQAANR